MQFTMDIDLDAIGQPGLREFVGRYLNAGHLPDEALTGAEFRNRNSDLPNACLTCADMDRCHATFGVSEDGYGLYPFNGAALDRLVELASPGE